LTQHFRIDAAPEYLAMKLNILYQNKQDKTDNDDDVSMNLFRDDDNAVHKITEFSKLPIIDQYLKLTQDQVNTSAQLRYKLSAVLSHSGQYAAGHWIAAMQRSAQTYSINDDCVVQDNGVLMLSNPQVCRARMKVTRMRSFRLWC
jgi:ubiquitin C-terminal hydrolase